ncbi:DIM/SIM/IMP family subclass B1 metallo-beta-lactamase [Aestuariicella hydrocarbonica]|uniref:beta-lactamase n=1 Tax=Pseudomaricurvus hydrocarbonicus TaxID=1470433 RepID=A0A9E5MPW5_9GAMM|nr:DIM/SIM/IMP family subclass B1 metallo-beta-lactamase [Aestuariicella hydrocarbonica]NHO68256.1 DIM/SIM/IMP family subclass B1 metallo-beta-lactamase [Aestuariicella hydrocarbonica]
MKLIVSLAACWLIGNVLNVNAVFASESLPEIEISEIQPGVFLHTSNSRVEGYGLVSSNGLVVVDGSKAFIIDTPWSDRDTQQLVAWIHAQQLELMGSLSTHSHQDRTAGIPWLNAQAIPTYASVLTNELLKQQGQALASNPFEGPEFSIADGLIEIYYPGGGHTIDNLVVWLPRVNILVGGCLIRALGTNNLGYTGEASIEAWPTTVAKVQAKYPNAKWVIPGHGEVGDQRLLEHTKQLSIEASN